MVDAVRGLVNLSKAPGVLVVAAPDQSHLVEELRRAGCRACVSTRSGDTVVRALDMLSTGRECFPDWRNSGPRERARGNSGASTLLKNLNRSEVEILAFGRVRRVEDGLLPPRTRRAGRPLTRASRSSGTGPGAIRAVGSLPGSVCVPRWPNVTIAHDQHGKISQRHEKTPWRA